MADLSITVNYRVPGKSCDWIRIVLFCIVWYALGVIAIAVNYHWLAQPHNYNWLSNFVIPLFGAMYAYFPFCVIAGRLKELNLFIDAAGMLIPPAFGIGSYRQVRWSELRSIDIDNYHRIRLTSISTKTKLDTTRLGAEEVEKVLLAIELFSPGTQWSQRSLQFKDSLHNGNAGVQGLTFTQMWDEELRRHFNATTFVPHEPGAKLRSGDLTIIRQLAFGGFSAVYLWKIAIVATRSY